MIARRRAGGFLGRILDAGVDGSLELLDRRLTWKEGDVVRWAVDVGDVEVVRTPTFTAYDLVLRVGGADWHLIVDERPIRTFQRGLFLARRRRDAALTMLGWIEHARRR